VAAYPSPSFALVLVVLLQACRVSAPEPNAPVAIEIPPIDESSSVDPELAEPDADLDEVATPYRGKWEGRGVQDDGQRWDIVVEVLGSDQKPCARVEYPPKGGSSVSCGGEWHCDLPPSTAARLVGVERILEGQGRCIDGCRVDFDLRRGRAAFDCPGVTAEAELERVR